MRRDRRLTLHLLTLLAIALGAVVMAAGEADDSPGLGGIGLIVIVTAITVWVRSRRRA